MAENVVFTGIGRSEKPKKRLAERVVERVKNRLKQNTGEIVEKKWMEAYERIFDAIDPGMRKKIVEKLKIVAKGHAKLHRFGTYVIDTLGSGGGMLISIMGLHDALAPGRMRSEGRSEATDDRGTRQEALRFTAVGAGMIAIGETKVAHITSGWFADIVGAGGEKVAQITNKILRGKPKAAAV